VHGIGHNRRALRQPAADELNNGKAKIKAKYQPHASRGIVGVMMMVSVHRVTAPYFPLCLAGSMNTIVRVLKQKPGGDMSTNLIGLNKAETAKLVEGLNQLLANYQVFYMNVRGFHWNIKGEKFFELHAKFE
jgi:hypothetical protein